MATDIFRCFKAHTASDQLAVIPTPLQLAFHPSQQEIQREEMQ